MYQVTVNTELFNLTTIVYLQKFFFKINFQLFTDSEYYISAYISVRYSPIAEHTTFLTENIYVLFAGKRAFIAGVADDNGYGWAIAKSLAAAGAEILVGTWVPVSRYA